MALLTKRDITQSKWYLEPSEYFNIEKKTLIDAVSPLRIADSDWSQKMKDARESLAKRFMSSDNYQLYLKVKEEDDKITDEQRSLVWREYIFVCLNSELRNFQRFNIIKFISQNVVKPILNHKGEIRVLDYGCGASVFTRYLAQEFGNKVVLVTADVCKYAVEYTEHRNRLYAPRSKGYVIEEVLGTPDYGKFDLIYSYAVFEHLPNAYEQVKNLKKSLHSGGVLIENYSGHSSEMPHKSDTVSAIQSRDKVLAMLERDFHLLTHNMPLNRSGVYDRDIGDRFWINDKEEKYPWGKTIERRIKIEELLGIRKFRGLINRINRKRYV